MTNSATKTKKILRDCKAIIEGDHFVYSSGKHGDFYINKDALYMHPKKTDDISSMVAELIMATYALAFDFIVSPTYGGTVLGSHVADYLNIYSKDREIMFAYSDQDPVGKHRVLRRGFAEAVRGKRVLLVDDIVTTGRTLVGMSEAVLRASGVVVGAAVICDRGKIRNLKYFSMNKSGIMDTSPSQLQITPLIELDLMVFKPEECPFCKANRPINIDLGMGASVDPFKA